MNAPSKAIPILVCLALAACGYSEEEMQARITRISELETELEETRSESQRREAALQERLNEMSEQNQELAGRLRELGQEVEGLVSERVDLQQRIEPMIRRPGSVGRQEIANFVQVSDEEFARPFESVSRGRQVISERRRDPLLEAAARHSLVGEDHQLLDEFV